MPAMNPTPAFAGRETLVRTIDEAVALGDPAAITARLRASLSALIDGQEVCLPDAVRTPADGRYARRLLHQSEHLGYTVIAMTWGPGQGTPIHDHDGLWCVEGVWSGRLEITPYSLVETDGARQRFAPQSVIRAGRGSTGSLIPPFEYHTIRNADDHEIAVTVHVYGQAMNRCAVFEPVDGGWYRRQERTLALDPV
jgi:predicted metal-dependent enzyme (double-stranded beta helix superfamily)